jgi:hypothetical protein
LPGACWSTHRVAAVAAEQGVALAAAARGAVQPGLARGALREPQVLGYLAHPLEFRAARAAFRARLRAKAARE